MTLNSPLGTQPGETPSVRPLRAGATYYDVLKVDADASADDIRKSYRALVQIWHPDMNRHNPAAAENKIKMINEAYRQLMDRGRRSRYDQMLARQKQLLAAQNQENGGAAGDSLLKQFLFWVITGKHKENR